MPKDIVIPYPKNYLTDLKTGKIRISHADRNRLGERYAQGGHDLAKSFHDEDELIDACLDILTPAEEALLYESLQMKGVIPYESDEEFAALPVEERHHRLTARICLRAQAVFNNYETFTEWFNAPNPELDNLSPSKMIGDVAGGYQRVIQLLNQVEKID